MSSISSPCLKTALSLLCAWLGLASALLAGCSPASATPTAPFEQTRQSTPNRTPQRTPTHTPTPLPTSDLGVGPADLQGVTVLLWHPFSERPAMTLDSLVAQFNRENEWGISAQAISFASYDRLSEQMEAALEDDKTPHLVLSYQRQAQTWDSVRTVIVRLDDYLNDPLWGFSPAEQADFIPAFWEQGFAEGGRLGIPALRYAQVIYYNLTWGRELGFSTPPTTPAQFEIQACAAARQNKQDADRQNDGSGGYILTSDYPSVLGWLYAFGAEVVQPGGRGYRFDTPEVERAFTFLRELFDEGCAWLAEGKELEGDFVARRALFIPGSLSGIQRQESLFADLESKDEWTIIPFPSPTRAPTIPVYGPSFQMLRSTPAEQLASWLLLKWLASPQNLARLAQSVQAFPARSSSLEQLTDLTAFYPQWQQALELLNLAQPEPELVSWHTVRWAVSDAATQLTRYYFTIDQVPQLVRLLDDTADELYAVDR